MKNLILFLSIFSIMAIMAMGCGIPQSETTTTSTTTTTTTSTTSTTIASGTNIIRMYYTYPTVASKAIQGQAKDYTSQNFGSAYSSDGINFTQDSGARFGPVAYLTDPDVFKESSSKWVMFYSKAVSSDPSVVSKLFKATSTTPTGTFADDNAFVDNYGNISSTIKIGSTFYVYGASTEGVAISTYDPTTNRLTYVKTAVSGSAVDPSVIQLSANSFKLYYKSSGNTYCMDSTDGLTWTNSTLIASMAEVPGAIYLNNKIYLYYVDGDTSSVTSGKFLLITSSDNGATYSTTQVATGFADGAADPNPVAYE